MSMDPRRLRSFVTVVDEGSITSASKRLHIAQPALSRQMVALETELGVTLLERGRSGAVPTPAGRLLAERGRDVLGALDALEADVRAMAGRGRRRLRVGVWAYTAPDEVHALAVGFRADHPEAKVDVVNVTRSEPTEQVASGLLDVAFSRLAEEPGRGMRWEMLRQEALVAAVPADGPLGRRRRVTIPELVAQPWAFYEREDDPVWVDQVMAACDAVAGRRPSVLFVGSDALDNLPHVAAGDAVTVVSSSLADALSMRGVRWVPIVDDAPRPGMVIPLSMTWRADNRSATLAAFLDAARSFFAVTDRPARTGR